MGSSLVTLAKQTDKEDSSLFCKAVNSQPFSLVPELHLMRKMTLGFVHKFKKYRKYLGSLWERQMSAKNMLYTFCQFLKILKLHLMVSVKLLWHFCKLHLLRKMTVGFVHKFTRYRKYLWCLMWNADVCQKSVLPFTTTGYGNDGSFKCTKSTLFRFLFPPPRFHRFVFYVRFH